MSAALTATGVGKAFGTDPPVLHDIDFSVSGGELVVVHGLPGSGRSALLRCLAGTYRPGRGRVLFELGDESVDLARVDTRTLAWIRRNHLVAFDGALAAPPSQDAASAVARMARVVRGRGSEALARLGLERFDAVPLGRLRPAQRRAVALAAALQAHSAVLLLDEPDTAAEPDRVADWIDERRAIGTAVIAATHSHSSLTTHASATAVLNEGNLQWTRR